MQAAAPEPGQKALLLSSDAHSSLHRVLVTLFAGPPAPGLVFWASQSSTEDQLEQFLLCASSNR